MFSRAYPEASRPLLDYHEAVLRSPSPLTAGERELIAAYVSGLNDCTYCHGVHTQTAARFGIPENLVGALLADVETAPVEPRMRALLAYVGKLTRTPSRVTAADAEDVRAAGWSDDALFHAVSTAALFNLMNRLVDGLGITAEAEYFTGAADRLAGQGYAADARALSDIGD